MAQAPARFSCTVLIPAHNEVGTIREVVEEVLTHTDRVLVINDGSTDDTAARLGGLPVELLSHAENLGKGARLVEGIEHAATAGATHVLSLDADRQHDPADIPAFIAAARSMPQALILGERTGDRASTPWERAAAIRFGDFFISWAMGERIRDAQCGMRVYPTALWSELNMSAADCQHFVFETSVLLHAAEAGHPIARVPIAARYGDYVQRPSHFRPCRDLGRIAGSVVRFIGRGWFRPRGLLIAIGILR